jgi:hypothetical protein
MPKFECHYCTQHIDADDSLGGQNVDCPTCGTALTVPLGRLSRQPATVIESPSTPPQADLKKLRNFSGFAALGALAICALCVVIPYASAGARGMALLTSDVLIGQTLGRWFGVIFVASALSAAIAGVASAFKKKFAVNFFRVFPWVIVAVSLLQLPDSIKEGAKLAEAAEKADKALATKRAYSTSLLALEKAAQDVSDAVESGAPTAAPPSTSKASADAIAESEAISTIISGFAQDAIAARKEYEQALQKAGIGTLLDADRMAKDTNFTQTLAMLMQLRSAAKQNREKFEALMESLPKRVDGLELSASTKRSLLAGFEKGFQKSIPQMREGLDLEDKAVDLFEKAVDHLIATKGKWAPSNGMFMFYEDADLEVFNRLMQQINDCVQRQEEIQKAAATQTSDTIENLKKMMRD